MRRLITQLEEAVREQPSKAVIQKAVKNMQLYLGLIRDPRARVRDQENLKAKVDKSVAKIVKATGNYEDNVWDQLETEARSRGVITPLPGKDL